MRHKDDQRVTTPNKKLERMGIYSLLLNIGLVVLKLGLAALSGSLAVAASATDSAVDIFSSVAVLVGLAISRRKTKTFPFGLYKVENMVSIVIALLVFFAGYEVAKEALVAPSRRLITEWWILAGVGVTVLVPFLFSRYELTVGRATNSPSLMAEARQFQTDVLSSGIAFVSLVAGGSGFAVDRVAALLIVPFIAKSGWDLMEDGMKELLDASLDTDTLAQVRALIQSYPGVAGVKSVVGRNSGRYRFLQADIEVHTTDLKRAHRLSEDLEEAIRAAVSNVERVVVHYEPRVKTSHVYGVPLEDPRGTVSDHLGRAPYFAMVEVSADEGDLLRQEIVANPHRDLEKQKGIEAAKMLVRQGVDVLFVKESLEGRGPSFVLADAGVEMRLTEAGTLDEILAEVLGQGSEG